MAWHCTRAPTLISAHERAVFQVPCKKSWTALGVLRASIYIDTVKMAIPDMPLKIFLSTACAGACKGLYSIGTVEVVIFDTSLKRNVGWTRHVI